MIKVKLSTLIVFFVGIVVTQVSIANSCPYRSPNSIFGSSSTRSEKLLINTAPSAPTQPKVVDKKKGTG